MCGQQDKRNRLNLPKLQDGGAGWRGKHGCQSMQRYFMSMIPHSAITQTQSNFQMIFMKR